MANGEDQDKQFSRRVDRTSKAIGRITSKFDALKKSADVVGHGFDGFYDTAQKLQQTLMSNKDALSQIRDGSMSINKAQELQNELKKKANKFDEQAADLSRKLVSEKSKLTDQEKKQAKAALDRAKNSAQQAREFGEQVQKENSYTSRFKKKFINFFSKKDKKNSEDIGKETEKTAKAQEKGKKSLSSMLGTAGFLGAAIKYLADLFFKVGNEVAQIGRELGVSRDEAAQIRQHFVNIANSSDNLRNTYEEIMKAQSSLNDALGTAAKMISADILDGMATLSNTIGLSDDAIVNFGRSALASGKSVELLTKEAARGAIETQKEFGVRVKFPKLLESVGKTTGQVRAIMGANFELMSKTVSKAQLLGREMSQVASESKTMLDFQSSIEKEMKAELFLGKQLNLERARLAALTGDYDTYMDEIVKNAGDFYEFSKLNVLQQDALAASLGMSTDALADMLLQREDLASLQARALEDNDEELLQYTKQLSLQEQMTALWTKLQNILLNLMAKLEATIMAGDSWILNSLGVTKDIFDDVTAKTTTTTIEGSDSNGMGVTGRTALAVNDFVIKTHPKDTLVMAGGTQLGGGGNSGMSPEQANELIRISKMNRVFSYDGFAAVKEAGHYGTKFN